MLITVKRPQLPEKVFWCASCLRHETKGKYCIYCRSLTASDRNRLEKANERYTDDWNGYLHCQWLNADSEEKESHCEYIDRLRNETVDKLFDTPLISWYNYLRIIMII